MNLLELFCDVDDFCLHFFSDDSTTPCLPSKSNRGVKSSLCLSEIMTIMIHFHQSAYRHFKGYYQNHVLVNLRSDFPHLVSYNRFVELMPTAFVALCFYLHGRLGASTGIAFVDSTSLPVCHNRRIQRHAVFAGLAARGKNSVDWFYGFKLHLIVNECGELITFHLTPANVDDRQPVPLMTQHLLGKLFGDKGYISQPLTAELQEKGVQLITPLRKNMKNRLLSLRDAILLRKRVLIETINDQLKNISQIAHSRHRSINNFLVNVVSGLIAYTHQEKKPSLHLSEKDLAFFPAVI